MNYEPEKRIIDAECEGVSKTELLRLKRERAALRDSEMPMTADLQRRLKVCSDIFVEKISRYMEEIELQLKGYMSLPVTPISINFYLTITADLDHERLHEKIEKLRNRKDKKSRDELKAIEHQYYEVQPNFASLENLLFHWKYNFVPEWMDVTWTADIAPVDFLRKMHRMVDPLLEIESNGHCRALEELKFQFGWCYQDMLDIIKWEINLRTDFPNLP